MIVNDELERMWEEAVFAFLKAPCQNFPGRMKENVENPVTITDIRGR
jgi:hypothetical protein